jgi:hypothetical protein
MNAIFQYFSFARGILHSIILSNDTTEAWDLSFSHLPLASNGLASP